MKHPGFRGPAGDGVSVVLWDTIPRPNTVGGAGWGRGSGAAGLAGREMGQFNGHEPLVFVGPGQDFAGVGKFSRMSPKVVAFVRYSIQGVIPGLGCCVVTSRVLGMEEVGCDEYVF